MLPDFKQVTAPPNHIGVSRMCLPPVQSRRSNPFELPPFLLRRSGYPIASLVRTAVRKSKITTEVVEFYERSGWHGQRTIRPEEKMAGATATTGAKANSGGDPLAFAQRPESIGKMEVSRPQTGAEYIKSLRDGREVLSMANASRTSRPILDSEIPHGWRPASSTRYTMTSASTSCRYRRIPSTGERPHAFFKAPKTMDELIAGRDRSPSGRASPTAGWAGRRTTPI